MRRIANTRLQIILYIGAALMLVFFAGTLTLGAAAGHRTCLICHKKAEAITSWGRSSHASIACAACHVAPGFKNIDKFDVGHFIQGKAGDTDMEMLSLGNGILPPVSSKMCLRCHSPKNRPFTFTRGLIMKHDKHLANGIDCVTCHNLVAHPLAETPDPTNPEGGARLNGLNMIQGCWRCHGVEESFRDKKLLATLPKTANPPTDCKTCHNKLWNLKPSLGAIKHTPEAGIPWSSGTLRHGKKARKVGFPLCFGCHDRQKWCGDECHNGVAMPHNISKYGGRYAAPGEPQWLKVHYKVAAKDSTGCDKCHNSVWLDKSNDDYCMACHHKKFYETNPDLGSPWFSFSIKKNVAMQYVKKNGSADCWECHQPDFCAFCHMNNRKPAPGTTFVR